MAQTTVKAPCFIVFRFYVYVHTSFLIFTNNSEYILATCFTKYVYKNKSDILAYNDF